MKETLLRAAAIALAMGIESKQENPSDKKTGTVNTIMLKQAIETAKKALEAKETN